MSENWVSNIRDDVAINNLAIPGTHDSASWTKETTLARTFTWAHRVNFTEQLDLGIRALDLRVGWKYRWGDNAIQMFHGPRAVNDQTLDDVLEEIKTWLDDHGDEFVILMFQQQGALGNKSDCREQVAKVVKKHFKGDNYFSYSAHHASWPPVTRVRGRVLVMERLQSRQAGWYDVSSWADAPTGQLFKIPMNLWIYLQDKYKGVSDAKLYNPMSYEVKKKMEYVKAAAEADPDGEDVVKRNILKINHTSYSNKKWQPYESGAEVNKLLRASDFTIQGIMMIDDADQDTVDHILTFNEDYLKEE